VQPEREVAAVNRAVAKGDLAQADGSESDGRPLTGEFLAPASRSNTMVDQAEHLLIGNERVAREVGTEGKLGGQRR